MSGYYGYSMSNNAVSAYFDGERPLSKWTKAELISAVYEVAADCDKVFDFTADELKKLTVKELKSNFLYLSSWHHTSSHYNRTDFYSIDESAVEDFNKNELEKIISSRKPKEKKTEPKKIVALCSYDVWTGSRNYPKKSTYQETLTFFDTDKMVKTTYGGNKRKTSINIIKIISEV